ncbi:MAG: leucine-rich repeat domain-containing protein [Clostridiales bacterium]|nr:leucine-rich repeat domain-containing protein [Clostridiales bacterium]
MAQSDPQNEELLLYDPLFETPPDTVIRDKEGKGFFGKAVVRKTVFIITLLIFVGVTIGLSFSSLTKERFHYEETDGGYMLSECSTTASDTVLTIDVVLSEDGTREPDKKVVAVRQWAFCCDENVSIIFIGRDVREIANTSFYSCTALQAVIVDPENPNYLSSDGVLYRKENGRATELILYPARCDLYRAMLSLGASEPADEAAARSFVSDSLRLGEKSEEWREAQQKGYPDKGGYGLTEKECLSLRSALRYEIPTGVTRIGEMAFAECGNIYEVEIPEGVREFASMAFFKCAELSSLCLPDSTEIIGSDAFSYCAKISDLFIPARVSEIGHHAFFGCDGVKTVRMACGESDMPATDEDWMPKERRLFLHDVPISYGEKRGAE